MAECVEERMMARVGVMHNSAGALFLPAHQPTPHLHQTLDKHALEQVQYRSHSAEDAKAESFVISLGPNRRLLTPPNGATKQTSHTCVCVSMKSVS